MVEQTPDDLARHPKFPPAGHHKYILSAFFSQNPPNVNHPSLIHFSSTPLFRLETCPEKYAHLLKKKDREYLGPIVNYFINKLGHVVFLGGDAVKNLYIHGRKKYKTLTLLAILTSSDLDKYASIMNSIISSNDGAFSMGLKYRVRKNRQDGCFKEIALARYLIEPRLESLEKLLYPLRSSTIDLNLTTQQKFSQAFGNEVLSTKQPVML
ncbi:MAG: hypothetical protein ACM32I_00020 [Nitrospirota bacterium]|jgi:hypothetical protein